MKKDLYELTLEEFTRILLDYEKVYELNLNSYDQNGNKEQDTLKGTYSQLYDVSITFKDLHKRIIDLLFDYDIVINDLDIYNYLERKTNGFGEERVKIVLSEMDLFYNMTYIENIDVEVENEYIKRGEKRPLIKVADSKFGDSTMPDYKKMREHVFPCREWQYAKAIFLLKGKLNDVIAYPVTERPILPKDLVTDRAIEYFTTAIKKGYMKKTETGYKWLYGGARGCKVCLAYFTEKVFCPNNNESYPETELDKLFGVTRLQSALTQMYDAKKPQKWRNDIDSLFEDKIDQAP